MMQKKKSGLWKKILCWVLIAMMIIGAITYSIYFILGLF